MQEEIMIQKEKIKNKSPTDLILANSSGMLISQLQI